MLPWLWVAAQTSQIWMGPAAVWSHAAQAWLIPGSLMAVQTPQIIIAPAARVKWIWVAYGDIQGWAAYFFKQLRMRKFWLKVKYSLLCRDQVISNAHGQGNYELWSGGCLQSEMWQDSRDPLFLVQACFPSSRHFSRMLTNSWSCLQLPTWATLCKCAPATEEKSSPLWKKQTAGFSLPPFSFACNSLDSVTKKKSLQLTEKANVSVVLLGFRGMIGALGGIRGTRVPYPPLCVCTCLIPLHSSSCGAWIDSNNWSNKQVECTCIYIFPARYRQLWLNL